MTSLSYLSSRSRAYDWGGLEAQSSFSTVRLVIRPYRYNSGWIGKRANYAESGENRCRARSSSERCARRRVSSQSEHPPIVREDIVTGFIRGVEVPELWVILRGDFVKDRQERAIDAEFVRAELHTGDRPEPPPLQPLTEQLGIQGGVFQKLVPNSTRISVNSATCSHVFASQENSYANRDGTDRQNAATRSTCPVPPVVVSECLCRPRFFAGQLLGQRKRTSIASTTTLLKRTNCITATCMDGV